MLTLTFGLVQHLVPARTCGRDSQIFDTEAKTQNRSGDLDRCCFKQKLSYGGHKMATTNGAQFRENRRLTFSMSIRTSCLCWPQPEIQKPNPTALSCGVSIFFFFAGL
jgi:hypothetical protein